MPGPEKKVENEIKKYLDQHKFWYFKVAASPMMPPGIPDIIACIGGLFVGIEVKAPGKLKNTSEVQKVQHELIKKAGGGIIVADSLKTFEKELMSYLSARNMVVAINIAWNHIGDGFDGGCGCGRIK